MVRITQRFNERFVQNWITTLLGIAICLASLLMFWQSKITAQEVMLLIPFGLAIAGIKYKKSTCKNEQGTQNYRGRD